MSSRHGPDRTSQQVNASGQARVQQAGRDQYIDNSNTTTVWGAGSGPAPRALAGLPTAVGLVGREAPTGELLDVLDPSGPGPGVVVVTGLAGIGKTALALQCAQQARARGWFRGGTLFVSLRGYDPAGSVSGEQALRALLRALGIRDDNLPPSAEEQQTLYRSELARRSLNGPVLVVADDASTTTQLEPLIPAGPEHRLLATSRDALTGPGLPARLIGLNQLDIDSAAALLTGILVQARPDDPRPRHEAEALREMAVHCGGLPLALTIVAAQLTLDPGLPLAVLAADLADARTRLEALRYEDRDGRSFGAQAAFELSYRRLDDQPARLFRLLSLNPGPDVSTDTAAVLAQEPVRTAREDLACLARAGVIDEQPVGSNRWRMHDLTRLYADELCRRHDSEPTRQRALKRLLDHYDVTIGAANRHLYGLPGQSARDRFPDRTAALAWLDAERLNVTAAIPLAAVTGHPRTALALADGLYSYLHDRRYFHDALITVKHFLTTARELGDRHSEAAALNSLGETHLAERNYAGALHACTESVHIAREIGDRRAEGWALTSLSRVLIEVRAKDAIKTATAATTVFQESGDRDGQAEALSITGMSLYRAGRLDEAIDACQQAVTIARDLDDHRRESSVLGTLGVVLSEVGRYQEGIDAFTRALRIARKLGDRRGEALLLNNLAGPLKGARRADEAINATSAALALFREDGHRRGESRALSNLCGALQQARRYKEAIDAGRQAAAIADELNDDDLEALALANLAPALLKRCRLWAAIKASIGAYFARENDYEWRTAVLMIAISIQGWRSPVD